MRLLLANPNTTDAITQRMAVAARAIAAPGTEIVTATAAFGAAVIATRTEMAVAEHAAVDVLARHGAGCDAAIVGASLDSGLWAGREMLGVPVLGLTQAALHTACLLGGRFGLVVVSAHNAVLTREMIEGYGLGGRMAGMRWLATSARDVLADPDGFAGALRDAAVALAEQDLADIVVLIGAVMAGMPARIQDGVPVPVLEGVSCAVPLAEALVRLQLPRSTRGSFAPLGRRALAGVDPAILARFGG